MALFFILALFFRTKSALGYIDAFAAETLHFKG